MPLLPITLGTQSNPGRFSTAGSARLINLMIEQSGQEGKTTTVLYPVAGLAAFATMSGASGGVRAMLATDNWLYVVAGRLLFRVDVSGAATIIGGIPTDGLVTMARNRAEPVQIGINSDGLLWVCTDATLTQNTDADLPPSSSLAVLDGYGILPGFGSVFHLSDIDDFTTFDPLDFASAESSPDATMRVAVRESEVVFFGRDSTEWWGRSGGDFPFARVQTARIGCLSAASVAAVDRTLAWVAHDGTVRLMDGYGGKVISHHAVDRFVADEPDKTALVATTWAQDGHTVYCLSGTNGTWVYDLGTGLWHNRESYGLSRWRCSHVVQFAGRTIAGDATTGALYEMHRDYADEAGEPLITTSITPPNHAFPERLQVAALHLDIITGQGLVPGDATTTDPQIMIAASRDGGATFGPERMMSMGARGDRVKRVVARRWGTFGTQGVTWRVSSSAAVARGFLSATMDAKKLRV